MKQLKKSDADKEKDRKIFVGYTWYKMKEFNNKLRCENNEEINGGINIGMELSPFVVDKGDKIPFIQV